MTTPPDAPPREPAFEPITRDEAEAEMQRVTKLTMQALVMGHPPHIALAALEVHFARLLDRVFAEVRGG